MCFTACVILRFTTGVTFADCVEVSMAAEPFQSMYSSIPFNHSGSGSGLTHDLLLIPPQLITGLFLIVTFVKLLHDENKIKL